MFFRRKAKTESAPSTPTQKRPNSTEKTKSKATPQVYIKVARSNVDDLRRIISVRNEPTEVVNKTKINQEDSSVYNFELLALNVFSSLSKVLQSYKSDAWVRELSQILESEKEALIGQINTINPFSRLCESYESLLIEANLVATKALELEKFCQAVPLSALATVKFEQFNSMASAVSSMLENLQTHNEQIKLLKNDGDCLAIEELKAKLDTVNNELVRFSHSECSDPGRSDVLHILNDFHNEIYAIVTASNNSLNTSKFNVDSEIALIEQKVSTPNKKLAAVSVAREKAAALNETKTRLNC